MTARPTNTMRPFGGAASRCGVLAALHGAALLLAGAAHAQADPCEQLKGVLAARIDATGVRGYSLEAVPADTPVPPGAKAIGSCRSGAGRILYRRWGAERPAPAALDSGVLRPALVPAAASAARQPVLRSVVAASAVAAPVAEPDKTLDTGTVEVALASVVDPPAARPEPVRPAEASAAQPSPAQRASAFIAEHWRWMGALLLMPIAALAWAWHAHRSAYDEAGLPRGPKL